jgi:hypothetical protein
MYDGFIQKCKSANILVSIIRTYFISSSGIYLINSVFQKRRRVEKNLTLDQFKLSFSQKI